MIYEPPNYQNLYEEQKEINAKLKREIKNVVMDMRDEFAMAIAPALVTTYASMYGGCFNGLGREVYDLADAMIKAREVTSE